MEAFDRKAHWENIFSSKKFEDVSWYQKEPINSLRFFEENAIPHDAKIIDVGGGDSYLAEFLIKLGYQDITVVEISANALERAQERMGKLASKVTWIVSDVLEFSSQEKFDVWHDRAVFHFLNKPEEQKRYLERVTALTSASSLFFLGTFSKSGPLKCSGIEITQYDCEDQKKVFAAYFEQKRCYQENHPTPFGTQQHFTFSTFQKKN